MDNRIVLKKHYKQMTFNDFSHIRGQLRNVRKMIDFGLKIKLSKHSFEKIKFGNAQGVTKKDILRVLENSNIIEYKIILKKEVKEVDCQSYIDKNSVDDIRVVLRSRFTKGKDNIIIVFSLIKNKVITIWKNNHKDNHENVDLSLYTLSQVGFY